MHFGLILLELQRNLQDGFHHLSCQLLVPTNFYLSNLNAFVSNVFKFEWLKFVETCSDCFGFEKSSRRLSASRF